MGERHVRRWFRGRQFQDYLTDDPGRRRRPSLLRWLRERRDRRRLVAARLSGGEGWYRPGRRDGGDAGGAGVREPRRPLPRSPQGAADLPRD